MSTLSDFYRLRLSKQHASWLMMADDPQRDSLGRVAYGHTCWVVQRHLAKVYVRETAFAIRDSVLWMYPGLEAEPATFAEWVEQKEAAQ